MRVLVACEFSGTVREAFAKLGHDAWSCDLLPTEVPSDKHLMGDVLDVLNAGCWDLIIAHPPCTHLSVSGARHFEQKRKDGRQAEGIKFFMVMIEASCPKVAVENPVCIMSRIYRKPDQIIQPYQFGRNESKKTCLWLKGLPLLTPTKIVEPVWWKNPDVTDYRDGSGNSVSPTHYLMGRKQLARYANQSPCGANKLGPSPELAKVRAKTYQGIADAMAQQWGGVCGG